MNNLYKQLFALLFLVLAQQAAWPQCPLVVNAGPDLAVCNIGSTVTLNGSVAGNALGFAWSPPTGLSNPNILNPTATVTGTATYTLTAQAFDPNAPNLITNGDFEAGNTGFTSSYTYSPMLTSPGTYVLTTSPSLVISTFPPCDDHTFGNGSGNMMLVNGAGVPGANVWCQTVTVMPDTWYVMSFWIITSPISPAQLQFSVNGTPVGPVFQATPSLCQWQQFSTNWFSGASAVANVCIVTQNAGNGLFGDDYALDDISMTAACSVSDQVTVSVVQVNASLPFTVFLPCSAAQTGIQLDGSASSSGPNISYQWTGPGILSGANTPVATVNMEGSYTLTVTYNDGTTTCTDAATVNVLPDPNIAIAGASAPNQLNCAFPTVTLDGGASSSGPGIAYNWAYLPGSGGVPPGIVSGGNTQYPVVNQPGTYILTVANTASGCTATASVNVSADFNQPNAQANGPDTLDCITPSLTLSGAGSSTGPPFTYLWTTATGQIVSGANTLNNCVVDAPGTYTLTVTNPQNGCTAVAFAVVAQNAEVPDASIAAPGTLDCDTPSLTLDGSASSQGPGFTYLWTTSDGNITSGANTLAPTVNLPGTYMLTVAHPTNGCTAADTVLVTGDATLPAAIAGPAMILDCGTTTVTLDGSASSQGGNFVYEWTFIPLPGGSGSGFVSGETTLAPQVNAPGQYVLSLTNTANGCVATDTTSVSQDGNLPEVLIAQPGQLDCGTTTLTLDASASSGGPNIQIEWTTSGGHFVSGETTLTPEINAPGTYTLTLTDPANGCSASASVIVDGNNELPDADAGPDQVLDCTSPTLALDGSASAQGGNFVYQWTTPDGNFVSGETTLTPEINAPGTYTLTVTNTANGCTATATTTVTEDDELPIADAGLPATLTCTDPALVLEGNASSQGANFTYQWVFIPAPGGTGSGIVSGGETLAPIVDGNGLYILTVANTQNGCTAVDSVMVGIAADFPDVQVNPVPTLTCELTLLTLTATASSGPDFMYLWTTPDGSFLSGETTLAPEINAPGTYTLTVTNTLNGCTATANVAVAEDTDPPFADAGPSFELSCSVTNALLDGSASTGGPGIGYLWTTANGNITAGANTLAPSVNAPGTYTLTVTNTANGCTATSAVTILQDAAAPTANAGNAVTLTCIQPDALLDGSASSTGPDITYLWTTADGNILSGETTLTPIVNAPGIYLLTVTNTANNCQTLASVQALDFTQPPVAGIGAVTPLTCIATSTTLDGNAPPGNQYLWAWSTGDGNILLGEMTPSPVVNAAGTYSATVTDPMNGCTATLSATVVQDTTAPTAAIAQPALLTCIAGEITLIGSSAGAGFLYGWNFEPAPGTTGQGVIAGGTTTTPTVNAPGTYTLLVTDPANGCTATASTIVLENTAPPTANAGMAPSFGCAPGGTLVLDGTGSSTGAGFAFLWTTQNGSIVFGETTPTPTINAPGTYTLTVTNLANGCTAAGSVTVLDGGGPPDAVIATPDLLTCAYPQRPLDGSASSAGPAITYQWTTPDGNFLSGETSAIATVNAPGTYILTVTNTENGCTASVQTVVNQNIAPPGASATADTLSCSEQAVAMTGSSPTLNVTFLWTTQDGHFLFGETTPTPAVDAPGTYTLIVTNPVNGCTSTASVTVVQFVMQGFSFETIAPDCPTGLGSIIFTGASGGMPPYRFSVDGGLNFVPEPVFEALAPGTYNIVILDDEGCKLSGTAVLPAPPVIAISLDPVVTVFLGDAWQLEPQINVPASTLANIRWSPSEGLDCDSCLRAVATLARDIVYTLEVTDVNGCSASASVAMTVLLRLDVYVPNAFSPNGDGINDRLVVFAKANQVARVNRFTLFTRWGESVFEAYNFPPNDVDYGWDGTHRGERLGTGVYVWFAEVELLNGETEILKGEVVLMR